MLLRRVQVSGKETSGCNHHWSANYTVRSPSTRNTLSMHRSCAQGHHALAAYAASRSPTVLILDIDYRADMCHTLLPLYIGCS